MSLKKEFEKIVNDKIAENYDKAVILFYRSDGENINTNRLSFNVSAIDFIGLMKVELESAINNMMRNKTEIKKKFNND
jgi:hypothetical protein